MKTCESDLVCLTLGATLQNVAEMAIKTVKTRVIFKGYNYAIL